LLVRSFEGLRDLASDRQRLVHWECSTRNALGQILTLYQLHDESRDAIRVFKAVDTADVRVIQRRERFCFALKTSDAVGIGDEEVGQDLECDLASELRVARAINLAHASRANPGGDFVGAEERTSGERHVSAG
jgi:hypothetical protein